MNENRQLATIDEPDLAAIAENVLAYGDLSKLDAQQRVKYYMETCESLGLNWRTRPFEYLQHSGKLVLYARRDCTDQLRNRRNVSVQIVARERIDDVYVVTARATIGGRTDESIGVVTIGNLKGDALANALMKAETKAKRRVTLSICGLGWLDESETETIPDARRIAAEIAESPSAIDGEQEQPKPASTGVSASEPDTSKAEIRSADRATRDDINGLVAAAKEYGFDNKDKLKALLVEETGKTNTLALTLGEVHRLRQIMHDEHNAQMF